jgi:hypothetical protein
MHSVQSQDPSPHPIQRLPRKISGELPVVVPLERAKTAPGRMTATETASVRCNYAIYGNALAVRANRD